MKHYKITIEECGGATLHPEYICSDNTTETDVVRFFGLNEPDVKSYSIELCKS